MNRKGGKNQKYRQLIYACNKHVYIKTQKQIVSAYLNIFLCIIQAYIYLCLNSVFIGFLFILISSLLINHGGGTQLKIVSSAVRFQFFDPLVPSAQFPPPHHIFQEANIKQAKISYNTKTSNPALCTEQDFFDLRPDEQLDNNFSNFSKKEKWVSKSSRTISSSLFTTYWREFAFAAFLGIVASVLAMGTPILTKKVLKFIEHDHTTTAERKAAERYILLWIVVYIVKVFLNEYAERLVFMVGLKVEQVLFMKLLNKIPKIPFSYKAHTTKTDLLNLFMIEVKLVVYFFKYASIIFTAPITILLSSVLIFMEGKSYGYLLIYVLFVAGVIGLVLDHAMSDCRKKKFHIEEERINVNLELTGQMRVLKQMGWEKLIPLKTAQFRQEENHLNFNYYIFAHIHDLVLVLIPLIVVAAIFLIQFSMDKTQHSLTVAEVYTIMYYVGMTYYPMKNMRSVIVSYYDMVSALKKLQDFFSVDEVVGLKLVDKRRSAGQLFLDNLALSQQPKMKPAEVGQTRRLSLIHKSTDKSIMQAGTMTVTIKFPVELAKGEKLVILSEEGEGSVLLSALIGSCSIKSGKCQYGGKVGYVPHQPWFQKSSIVDNILFGSPENREQLRKVCNIVGLTQEMEQFPQREFSLITDSNPFTDSQLKRIALARAFYSKADLYFLDEIFKNMDSAVIEVVYSNIKQYLAQQTVVFACSTANFLSPEDKVLVFRDGQAVGYGKLEELKADPHSYIHHYLDTNKYLISEEEIAKEKKIIQQQTKRRKQKLARRKAKLRAFVKSIVRFSRLKGKHFDINKVNKDDLKGLGFHSHDNSHDHGHDHGHHDHGAINGKERATPVSRKQYMRFLLSNQSKLISLGLVAIIILTQTLKVFLNWWIGHISHSHGKYEHKEEEENIIIYIEGTILFGLLAAVEGVISAYLSRKSADNLSQKTMKSLAGSELHFFETHDTVVISNKVNKDFEQIFQIHYYSQDILRNVFVFVFTLFLTALEAPGFMIMGVIIVVVNIGILKCFMRTEGQIMRYYTPFTDTLYSSIEAVIGGIDTAKVMGRKKEFIENEMKNIHNVSVLKLNERFIYHAMTILCELSTLVLIAWPAYYAVSNKSKMKHSDLALTATVISYSLKLTGLLTTIMREFVIVESGMRFNLLKAFYVQDLPQEPKYEKPVEKNWLRAKPDIEIANVSASTEGSDCLVLHQMSLKVQPYQRVAILGKSSSGLNAIRPLLERFTSPATNVDGTVGKVTIGGIDLSKVGRHYISEQVQGLVAQPLIFTSSVLQNIDPFGQYREKDIMRVVRKLDLEGQLQTILDSKKHAPKPKPTLNKKPSIRTIKSKKVTKPAGYPSSDKKVESKTSLNSNSSFSGGHHSKDKAHSHVNLLPLGRKETPLNKLLNIRISQADTKTKLRNSISIARTLLHKPSVLIVECTEPNTYDGDITTLLQKELPETTILYLNANLRHSLQLSRVGVVSHGVLAEWDPPFQLLRNPDSMYSRLLQVSEPNMFALVRKKSRLSYEEMDTILK